MRRRKRGLSLPEDELTELELEIVEELVSSLDEVKDEIKLAELQRRLDAEFPLRPVMPDDGEGKIKHEKG